MGRKTDGDLAKRFRTRGLMVTAEEQSAVQMVNFKDDERFWGVMRDLNAASAKEHRSLIAAAEAKLKGYESAVADPSEQKAFSAFSGEQMTTSRAGRIRQAQTSST